MRRREFIAGLGGAMTSPLAARAQQRERMRRIGILMPYAESDAEFQAHVRAFRDELRKRGWIEGANIEFDVRWTTDDMDRVRDSAASLSASKPDLMLAVGGRVIPILTRLAPATPMVIPDAADPVGVGIVQSLARPGGNITGFTFLELSQFGKAVGILKEIVPAMRRVGMIHNPDNPSTAVFKRTFEAAAAQLAIEPLALPIHTLADVDRAVVSLADRRDAGIFFPPDVTITGLREQVVAMVGSHGVPAIYSQPRFVKAGGLVFYGVDRIDLWRRSAEYVDRILRGEKPGDLPFQQPTKYQLTINLKTAAALGLTVPLTLQASADEVIE